MAKSVTRREVLQHITAVVAATAVPGTAVAQQAAPTGDRFFPGFKPLSLQVTGATINGVMAGQGPPVLLLHGAPQSHISWRLVAPELAKHFTVVATDLGGRVGHRMALDHADRVTRLAVLDIVPTYYLYTHVTLEFVQAYFHWFNYLRPAPAPENQLKEEVERQANRMTSDVDLEYLRVRRDPANIHGMCEDYRAGASIDLEHDKADLDRKIACPLRALWGAKAPMGRLYDVLSIWRERATTVTGRSLPTGHNLQEDAPDLVTMELAAFLRGESSPSAKLRLGRFARR